MPNLITSDVATEYVFTATAGQTTFPFNFAIFDAGDITVYQGATLATHTATPTTTTQYRLTGIGTSSGSIVFGAGLIAGRLVRVYRQVPVKRSIDVPQSGPFSPEIIDDEFDRAFAILQDHKTEIKAGIRMPLAEAGYSLPAASSRANKFLGFDSAGMPIMTTPPAGPAGPSGTVEASGLTFVTLQQFGGKGDSNISTNGTDNMAAYNAAASHLELLAYQPISGATRYQQLPTLYVPKGSYYFSDTVNLKAGRFHILAEPGAEFKFPVNTHGIIIHGDDTVEGGIDPVPVGNSSKGAQGTIIRNLSVRGGGGTLGSAHGIWARTVIYAENVGVQQFSGNGWNFVCDIAGSGTGRGNANGWRLYNCGAVENGDHGFFFDGGDVNAGIGIGLDAQYNGGFGIYDSSFLGNTFIGCHTDSNGLKDLAGPDASKSTVTAQVHYNGRHYTPRLGQEAACSTNAPSGTDASNAYWLRVRGTASGPFGEVGGTPTWVNGLTYRCGGSYATNHIAAIGQRSVFIGNYEEGTSPFSQIFPNSLVLGGFQANLIAAKLEMDNYKIVAGQIGGAGGNAAGQDAYSLLKAEVDADGNLELWRGSINGDLDWGAIVRRSGDWAWKQTGSNVLAAPWRVTSSNTTEKFGRAANMPNIFHSANFAFGFGTSARIMGMCTRAEGAAEIALGGSSLLAVGERYFYADPLAGGREGIVRTTTGVKEFGSIAS